MTQSTQETRPNKFTADKKPHCLKYDIVTSSKKMFNKFKELYPFVTIKSAEYKRIIEALNIYYLEYVLESGDIAILPHGMGKIMVQKNQRRIKKSKNGEMYMKAPVDWVKSKKEGKIIYHLNESTNGFTYRYVWFNKASYIKHSSLYFMAMTQQAKKMLKTRIEYVDENKDYKNLYKELMAFSVNRAIKKAEKYESKK